MFARGEISGGVAKCRGVIGGRFWKGEQVFGDDLQWVGGHLKMKLCPMGADVQEEDIENGRFKVQLQRSRVDR